MGQNVAASGMSIAPLEYRASLGAGEFKKGYIDVVNPDATTIVVQFSVQAFRQVDNQGGLQFYDNPAITKGVQLDLESVELGPREGARVYFQLDASSLPSGDVFAAIFATSEPNKQNVLTLPSARVGTLLMIQNGTPPKHHAEVAAIDTDWLQIGDAVTARLLIKNTDPSGGSAIGFSPTIDVALQPYTMRSVNGPLIFAGFSREVIYRQPGNYFGPLVINASIDGISATRLVFVVTGFWRWLAPLILVAIVLVLVVLRHHLTSQKRRRKKVSKTV